MGGNTVVAVTALLERPNPRRADDHIETGWDSSGRSALDWSTRRRDRLAAKHGTGYLRLPLWRGNRVMPRPMSTESWLRGNEHQERSEQSDEDLTHDFFPGQLIGGTPAHRSLIEISRRMAIVALSS
jgi:hypothetical protein